MFATLQSYAAPGDGTGDGTGGGSGDDTAVANPYIETEAKRIKQDYPLGTMTQWLVDEANTYALNPVNIRAGKHPDKSDPNNGPYDVVYIFPDAATANAWWDPITNPNDMPTTIPDTAVAFVHWVLDNDSGAFPGIMSKSDIDGFKSRNCIMSSGATIPMPGVKEGVPKDCSNPQGSSKRFKMAVLKADVPIDLVYNVEQADLTYTNYETIPTYNGIPESGRIYRVLQKWQNATATDVVDSVTGQKVMRDGVRMAGFRLELGTGVGDNPSDPNHFVAIPNANNDGLDPDKELGFELRPCMADHFFDVYRDRPGTGTNPCSDSYDDDGNPDTPPQALPQEIWLEEEYSTFSPKMYSFNTDKRTTPIGGWWDKRPGGIYPPEIQTLGKLDSGYAASESSAYFDVDRVDGALPLSGYYGATTPNYFDIVATQASGVLPDFDPYDPGADGIITPPGPFGYLMHLGVLADGDTGIASRGIYADPDGDPATEGDLTAWWDGDEYRWGIDPTFDGDIDEDAFTVVPRELLVEWAMFPLQEEKDPVTGKYPIGPLYELGVMDDLAGLNVDSFVYLGRKFTGSQFTIRLTAVPVDSDQPYGPGTGAAPGFPLSIGAYGNDIPAWVANPPKELADYINNNGVIVIRPDIAGQPIKVTLGDIIVGSLPTVIVENLRSGETENLTLLQSPDDGTIFTVSLPTAANGNIGKSNDGTLNVWPLDFIQVTYIDEFVEAPAVAPVTRTDVAQIPLETLEPVAPSDDSSGCSCSTSPDGSVDPILPAAVLFALGYLGLRRWETRRK
jgi:MYXO-CTERM domain-containing protein